MLALAMRVALGERIVFEEPLRCHGVGFRLLWQPPVAWRRVLSIDGLEHLREDPCVSHVDVRRGPGESVDWRAGNWEHVFAVFGAVPDHDALARMARRVHAEVTVLGE